jgi:hypothetical protein
MAVPAFDPYKHAIHFCDPSAEHHTAVCGRDGKHVVRVAQVTCWDCIAYIKQYVTFFLDEVEADVVRLHEIEDM